VQAESVRGKHSGVAAAEKHDSTASIKRGPDLCLNLSGEKLTSDEFALVRFARARNYEMVTAMMKIVSGEHDR
jgi:hypothetical protein